MWSFRRKYVACCSGEEVDERHLMLITRRNAYKRYVNLLIMQMANQGPAKLTLTADAPLPKLNGPYEFKYPSFRKVIKRLKVMAGLKTDKCAESRNGEIELTIQTRPYRMFVRFEDWPIQRVDLRLEEENVEQETAVDQ